MEKIKLGKSELMVSQVGFGGIPIQRLSEAEAVRVVRHCLDRGVSYLDTAIGYSTSEERIGKAIAGRREGLILASKSPAKDRAGLLANLDVSLRRLGVDYIDLYQLHNVSPEDYDRVVAPGGALEGAQEALRAGKIRHIGITSHSLESAKKGVASGLFETVMFPFNFVAREPGEELYPLAVEQDMGFIVMKPLGGGMLSSGRLAFKYLAQFPRAVAIPGIEKPAEMDEILGVLKEPPGLSSSDLAEIERIRGELGSRFCRRCDYCQPCPQGIGISTLMGAQSAVKRMPVARFLELCKDAAEKAADCEDCGECEARCPYGLPIRQMMDEAVSLYWREKARCDAGSRSS
jgi:predicted aldo/keto reductase-like oxidoreductase